MATTFHVIFDEFEFNSDKGLFHESGIKINLKPKELAMLELLVRRNGELVTKEQLIDAVWNGVNASDISIARNISVIKSKLSSASLGAELLIKTEYGRGYRFAGKLSFYNDRNIKKSKKQKKIGEIVCKDILNCEPSTTVLEAAHLLYLHRKSSILVTQSSQYVGIWTEADALALDLTDPAVFNTKISAVMHCPVITIQEWKPLSEAVLAMRNNGIRHLLVVDRNAGACGVISQTDLVRNHGVEAFLTLKDVRSITHKNPLIITGNLPISAVVQQMRSNVTDIAIINLPDRDMFIFTERDLMGLIATQRLGLSVSELTNTPLITVNEDTTLLAARQLMEIKQVRHLGVLEPNGNLLKILGLADILQMIEHSYVRLLEEILEENKQTILAKDDHIQMLTNAVQQTAGMILISDKFGMLEYVNKSFEEISGYTLEEVKGLNPRFLKSGNVSSDTYSNLWQTLMSGQTWKGELCNKSKAGVIYWVLASITPIYNEQGELVHYVAVEEDITERIKMESKLKEFEHRFYQMVSDSPVLFWESNFNGEFFYFSLSWLTFTGRKFDELYGHNWANLIHSDDLKKYLSTFQDALIKQEGFSVTHRLKSVGGEYRWVINKAKPRVNEPGDFLGFMGYCVDISETKN